MSTNPAPLAASTNAPNPLTTSGRRPTTPLRRISASSLRSLSRSQSLSSKPTTEPLAHLAPLLAELADAASDLTGNLHGLEDLQAKLEGFNEAFGGYLYGIRMNAYAVDFEEVSKENRLRRSLPAANSCLSRRRRQSSTLTSQLSVPPRGQCTSRRSARRPSRRSSCRTTRITGQKLSSTTTPS